MKGSIGDIRANSNIWGGRKLNGCTSSSKFKLHRKRVVHDSREANSFLDRRMAVGPDLTHYPAVVATVTQTLTSKVFTSTT
jgi:hypothetical protein